jgi:Alr-MurF fusion protein
VVFSTDMLKSFLKISKQKTLSFHLEMDTGMHRLGFSSDEINELTSLLLKEPGIEVKSIFTHLAAADEAKHDEFTQQQVALFQEMIQPVLEVLPNKPLLHVSNSSGVIRFGSFNTDMVRLGIGMYGIDVSETLSSELIPVFTFKTSITQIKKVKKGESVGYGRTFTADKDMQIAIIPVGYADGFNRKFSNGKGYVLINGKEARVCGTVCMDMTMLDVTGMSCKEQDEVLLFGNKPKVEEWAGILETIPYEVLTGISQRVKRVFMSGS